MVKKALIILLTVFFLMTAGKCSQPRIGPFTAVIALRNGLIIDGTGVEPISNGTLLISGNRISAIGSGPEVSIPEEARVFNLSGAAVLPGFFNSHIHSGYSESNLKAWAHGGVTTVRDVGAAYTQTLFSNRDQLNSDNSNARLVSAGPMLTVPNGYPIAVFNSTAAYPLNSMADIREKVPALIEDGADLLKLTIESGAVWGLNLPVFSPEEAAEIVQIGHQRGKKISAHVLVAADLARAAAAGVDDIAHMVVDNITDELIQQIVNKDIYWVPTLELFECVGGNLHIPAGENLKKFVRAGGQVALGTDYDGYYCPFELGMPMKEIGLMSRAEMTPMQIIVAATRNSAYVSGLSDELGTLTKGKIADIIVVSGNPLEDLETLANVRMVIKNGEIIRNDL